jgi:DNA-binding NtrC family response regulator
MRILVVDDEADVVSTLVEWLASLGHEVLGITGGSDVSHWVQHKQCEVVLIDLKLPDADGFSVISELSRTTPVQIIAMSGMDEATCAPLAIRNGAVAFLQKPIALPALQQVLDRLSVL